MIGERQIVAPRDSCEKSFFFTADQAIATLSEVEAAEELGDGTSEDIYIWASSCPNEIWPPEEGVVRSQRPFGY